MQKHTPGPWSVSTLGALDKPSTHYIFIEPGVAYIERKMAGQDEHDMPDALLIAAAPEMLAALRRAACCIAYASEKIPGIFHEYEVINDVIAKATGAEQ